MTDTAVTVIVEEKRNSVTIDGGDITVNVTPRTTSVSVSSAVATGAENIPFSGTGTVASAGSVASAIQTVADQQFRGTTAPSDGTTNLEEGDLFYDTDDDQLKVYRETSTNNFEFVPLAAATGTMDNLDGGLF
tara:strand:+ start:565 stop:963 length:399 start_codon:yes stop_codon:yes gene_type:complete